MTSLRWIAALLSLSPLAARVFIYPTPPEELVSRDFTVAVDGHRAAVLRSAVFERWAAAPYNFGSAYSFLQFDFEGSARVRVHDAQRSLRAAAIIPRTAGVAHTIIDDHTIEITLTRPCQLSVEPKGRERPLLIFANPPDPVPPARGSPRVLYFGPGIHRPESGLIRLESNQTLYLAGGAILEAAIYAEDAENITIRGRGVLDGARFPFKEGPGQHKGRMVHFVRCRNVRIEGIVIRQSFAWTIVPVASDGVFIENVKICNGRVLINDDGINPCNSRNVVIRRCFIRTIDDCVALKGKNRADGDIDGIRVEQSILWTDLARVTLLGHESAAPFMRNIVYRDIDIIHYGEWPAFLIEVSDNMQLANVLFENIRVRGEIHPLQREANTIGQQWLAVIRPFVTMYSENSTWGAIDGLTFRDISLEGPPGKYGVMVEGAADHDNRRIRNVLFENVTVNEERLLRQSQRVILGPWLRPADDRVSFR